MQGSNCYCHELVCSLIIVIIASQPWIRRNNHHTRSLWTVCSPSAGRAHSTGRRYYYPPSYHSHYSNTNPSSCHYNYTNNIRDPSIFLLRGLIGSYLPTQGSIGGGGGAITPAANDDSGHVVTGRFR